MFGSDEDKKEFEEGQLSQMAEMEQSFEGEFDTSQEDNDNKTDPPSTDPPMDQGTSPPATDPPEEEDETKTEPPATEEPEEDELADIKAEMAALREELKQAREGSPKTEPPPTEAPIEEEDFLGDSDPDDVTSDPKEFNKLLNKVYMKGVQTGQERVKTLGTITDESVSTLIRSNVTEIAAIQKASEDFYTDNKDLIPHRAKVSEVYKDLASANPDKDHIELLELTGPAVRKKYDIKPTKSDDKDDPPPRLPSKKRQQRQSQKQKQSDPVLNELDEMDKALEL